MYNCISEYLNVNMQNMNVFQKVPEAVKGRLVILGVMEDSSKS